MSIRAFLLSVLLAASMPVMAGVVISPTSPGDSCPNTPVWFKGTVTVDLTVLPSGEARSDAYPHSERRCTSGGIPLGGSHCHRE